MGAELATLFREEAADAGLPLVVNQFGAAAHAFVSDRQINTYADALASDPGAYRSFAGELLARGVHVTPKGLLYVSIAHEQADLDRTREAVGEAARAVAQEVMATG
jgi:glutamate-1-semialdehyde 2,1-aminomutase